MREQLGAQAEAIRQLTHQLDWFKKQLFGPISEKQVYDVPQQDNLFQPDEAPLPEQPADAEKRTIKAYQRGTGKKQRDDDCLNDTGLRFTADVPVKVIEPATGADRPRGRSVRSDRQQDHLPAGPAGLQLCGTQVWSGPHAPFQWARKTGCSAGPNWARNTWGSSRA